MRCSNLSHWQGCGKHLKSQRLEVRASSIYRIDCDLKNLFGFFNFNAKLKPHEIMLEKTYSIVLQNFLPFGIFERLFFIFTNTVFIRNFFVHFALKNARKSLKLKVNVPTSQPTSLTKCYLCH